MVTSDTNSDRIAQYSYIYNHLVKLNGQHISEACIEMHKIIDTR